jgi:hypothetical protein
MARRELVARGDGECRGGHDDEEERKGRVRAWQRPGSDSRDRSEDCEPDAVPAGGTAEGA